MTLLLLAMLVLLLRESSRIEGLLNPRVDEETRTDDDDDGDDDDDDGEGGSSCLMNLRGIRMVTTNGRLTRGENGNVL